MLSSDTNQEGKINQILRYLSEEEKQSLSTDFINLDDYFEMFPQSYISEESIRSYVTKRKLDSIEALPKAIELSEEERKKRRCLEIERQSKRIFLKKIDDYVSALLKNRPEMQAKDLPLKSRKEFLYAIYIRIYGQNSKFFRVERLGDRVKSENYEFSNFKIIKKG